MASYDGVRRASPVLSPASLRADGLRVAVVGGTGGLGRALALLLAERGAEVTVVGRTFRDEGTPRLSFLPADLETVEGARRAADALPAEDLDLLVLTTGILSAPRREVTADGLERDLAVSYVSRFVLLRAVGDRLGRSRPAAPRVFVMGFPGTGELGDPDDLNAERAYRQMAAHLNTVAANEALVLDAAARFPRLSIFGLNPGLVSTDIRANALGGTTSWRFAIVESLLKLFTPTPRRYAERVVPALLAPELDGQTGFHLNKKGQPIEPSAGMTPERVAAFTRATEALLARLPVAARATA